MVFLPLLCLELNHTGAQTGGFNSVSEVRLALPQKVV